MGNRANLTMGDISEIVDLSKVESLGVAQVTVKDNTISELEDIESYITDITPCLNEFKPLTHSLQFIHKKKPLEYLNESLEHHGLVLKIGHFMHDHHYNYVDLDKRVVLFGQLYKIKTE